MWISGQKNTPAGEFTCGFSLVSFLFVFICLQIRSQRSFCLLLLSYQTHKAFPSEASARLSCSQAYGSNRVPLNKKKKKGSTHINASHQMSPLVKRRPLTVISVQSLSITLLSSLFPAFSHSLFLLQIKNKLHTGSSLHLVSHTNQLFLSEHIRN